MRLWWWFSAGNLFTFSNFVSSYHMGINFLKIELQACKGRSYFSKFTRHVNFYYRWTFPGGRPTIVCASRRRVQNLSWPSKACARQGSRVRRAVRVAAGRGQPGTGSKWSAYASSVTTQSTGEGWSRYSLGWGVLLCPRKKSCVK